MYTLRSIGMTCYNQVTGIGVGGIFGIPPGRKIFENAPLEILRKSAIFFRKSRKNGKISLNLA